MPDTFSADILIKAYCEDGNTDQMGVLLKRMSPFIFGLCMKFLKNQHNAEDVSQDIMLHLLENICRSKINHFQSWLYIVVRNACFKFSKKKIPHLSEDLLNFYINEFVENANDPNLYYDEETFSKLTQCIEKLKEDQKRCFVNFYFQERSYKEIASLFDYELNQVKSHIQNGMRNVKICVLKKGENDG